MLKKTENPLKDSFFDDINGCKLDIYQRKIILDESDSLLVVAGAGSGKTLTIVGKIKYLIEKKNIQESDILCISFTNEAVENLKKKAGYNIDCFTFHKLSLSIIKHFNYDYHIALDDLLEYVTNEFMEGYIYEYQLTSYVVKYLESTVSQENLTYEQLKKDYPLQFNNYKRSIITFIKKIKTNNHDYNDFKKYVNTANKNSKIVSDRQKSFLIIVFHVLYIYSEELYSTNSIDFDDMISIATKVIDLYGVNKKYKYIIIDEFQDTSMIRYHLITKMIEKTNAKLICVGDDYQSIYSFSGCTLDLFINFNRYFPKSKIKYIKNTYRNPFEIIDTSCSFIKKNHYQLPKKLTAQFSLKKPLKIVYYNNENYETIFYHLLDYLKSQNQKNILVLGRYNNDIYKVFPNYEINKPIIYKDLNIRYLTVHRSKGLEEENIIILNMSDHFLGFPSKITSEEVFSLIGQNKEKYPFAEERRLFYVALTRTKNNVYLMVPNINPSIFISEIKSKTIELIIK